MVFSTLHVCTIQCCISFGRKRHPCLHSLLQLHIFGTQEPLFPMNHSSWGRSSDPFDVDAEDPEIEDSIVDMAQRYKDTVRSDVIQGPKIEGKVEREDFIMIWILDNIFGNNFWYLMEDMISTKETLPEVIGNDKSTWGETATLAIEEVWFTINGWDPKCQVRTFFINSLPHHLQQWNMSEGYLTLRPKNLDLIGWNAWNAWNVRKKFGDFVSHLNSMPWGHSPHISGSGGWGLWHGETLQKSRLILSCCSSLQFLISV